LRLVPVDISGVVFWFDPMLGRLDLGIHVCVDLQQVQKITPRQ